MTAGHCLGFAVKIFRNAQDFCRFAYFAVDFVLWYLAQFKTERHVFVHRHVGVQCVVLEHHCDVAVFGFHVVYHYVADTQFACGDFFKTGNHTKGCGLTAAGRSDEYDKLFVFDVHCKVVYRLYAVGVHLVDVVKLQTCHNFPPKILFLI